MMVMLIYYALVFASVASALLLIEVKRCKRAEGQRVQTTRPAEPPVPPPGKGGGSPKSVTFHVYVQPNDIYSPDIEALLDGIDNKDRWDVY